MASLSIVYATVTRNAEGVAEEIRDKAIARGWNVEVKAIDEVDTASFSKKSLVLLITSTTGDGDTPDRARKFLKYIRNGKKESSTFLSDVTYAVRLPGPRAYAWGARVQVTLSPKVAATASAS